MQRLLKAVGREKDNPTMIHRDIPTKNLLYKPKKLCV
jgi:hypothetical protein